MPLARDLRFPRMFEGSLACFKIIVVGEIKTLALMGDYLRHQVVRAYEGLNRSTKNLEFWRPRYCTG
jgi:hypothetical protein